MPKNEDPIEPKDTKQPPPKTVSQLEYIVQTGTEKRSKPLKGIRDIVQNILSRSLKISTLIGSGASFDAIPLMGTTFGHFKNDHSSDEHFKEVFKKFEDWTSSTLRDPEDIELFMSWLSQIVDNSSAPSRAESEKNVLKQLTEKFVDSVIDVDYESNDDKIKKVSTNYIRFLQGLGMSREILSRKERTVFDVVNLFTTNYDLFHEYALIHSNYHYADGFSSGIKTGFSVNNYHLRPVDLDDRFRNRLQPINPFFRLFKLHGSVDWITSADTSSQSGITSRVPVICMRESKDASTSSYDSLIKPMSSKYILTQGNPFSDLFREFVNILGEPDTVLFIAGYGFGDEHINNLISNALQRSDFLMYAFIENPEKNTSSLGQFVSGCRTTNATFIYPKSASGEEKYFSFEDVANCFSPETPQSIQMNEEDNSDDNSQ